MTETAMKERISAGFEKRDDIRCHSTSVGAAREPPLLNSPRDHHKLFGRDPPAPQDPPRGGPHPVALVQHPQRDPFRHELLKRRAPHDALERLPAAKQLFGL